MCSPTLRQFSRVALLALVTLWACATKSLSAAHDPLPSWISERLKIVDGRLDPGSAVLKYTVKGKDYYELPTPCCDQLVPLYNAQGILVCHPSGGFAGSGDGKCGDLFNHDVPAEVVWKKAADSKPAMNN